LKTLTRYSLKLLFLIICLSIPSLIYGVEVCKIPSGCKIDEKGVCLDCVEQEFEEETEEEILEQKIEEEKEQEERERFWKNVSLKIYGGYGTSSFSFEGKNNTSIDRPYINETSYSGFSLGTRLSLTPRVSYSISTFKGSIERVKINTDDESKSSLDENVFTTEMSGDISYVDMTIDYTFIPNQSWLWFVGLGVINLESDLVYRDLTYGSFKYEIDEQSLFLNSGFNFHFFENSFIGVDFKILPNFTYKSNNTDKKISQYNSSYNSPVLQMRITNLTLNYGMSF
tara:strand:+ start:99 stop:950 length:852 start_codon:yes stop_codon:yes gene_type:complete